MSAPITGTVQLSSDGLWMEGEQEIGQPGSCRFSILKSIVTGVTEAPWMTDQNGTSVVCCQLYTSQQYSGINAIASYDDIMALLVPAPPSS